MLAWVNNRKRKLAVPVARRRACLLDEVGELPQRRVHPRVDLHLVAKRLLAPDRILLLPGNGTASSGGSGAPLCRELREAHARAPPMASLVQEGAQQQGARSLAIDRHHRVGVRERRKFWGVNTRTHSGILLR